jgi:hypothetical protein
MYGGTLVRATTPVHDNAAGSGDDYASITITYIPAAANKNVQLLFGGHLAASPLNRGGWGPGLGSSNINGGPYHIKWVAADGASVGNRDNQIMGSSIQPLNETTMSTQPSIASAQLGSATFPASVTDTATLLGAAGATGSVSFFLYGPFATNPTATSCDLTTRLGSATGTLSNGSATSSPLPTPTTPGIYQWVAHYAGDSNNAPANGACDDARERFVITKGQPTLSTVATGPATVGTGTVGDTATVTGGYLPTGTVVFNLYGPSATADCTGTPVATDSVPLSGGTATASVPTPTTPGTYYWVATLPEGTHNLAATHECGAPGETLVVNPATPSATSTQSLTDRVELTGFGTPSGNVTFTLWSNSTCTVPETGPTTLLHTSTVPLVDGAATSTASPFLNDGTYYWKVTYAGDANNAAGVVEACGVQQAVIDNTA